jgi:hypothetical protein
MSDLDTDRGDEATSLATDPRSSRPGVEGAEMSLFSTFYQNDGFGSPHGAAPTVAEPEPEEKSEALAPALAPARDTEPVTEASVPVVVIAPEPAAETQIATEPEPQRDPLVAGRFRFRAAITLALVCGTLAVATVIAPWYRADVPDLQLRLRTGEVVQLDAVSIQASAWDLTHQPSPAPTGNLPAAGWLAPAPPTKSGLPVAHAFVLWAMVLAGVGAFLRHPVPLGAAAALTSYGFKHLGRFTAAIEDPRAGGAFVSPLWGRTAFSLLLAVTLVLLVGAAAKAWSLNRAEKAQLRQRMLDRGETPPPSGLDALWGLVSVPLSRIAAMGAQATSDTAR